MSKSFETRKKGQQNKMQPTQYFTKITAEAIPNFPLFINRYFPLYHIFPFRIFMGNNIINKSRSTPDHARDCNDFSPENHEMRN